MGEATGPETNRVVGDFSYTCGPHARDGWFMVGDAAAFIDPVWSTGVSLGIDGSLHAARRIVAWLEGVADPRKPRRPSRGSPASPRSSASSGTSTTTPSAS